MRLRGIQIPRSFWRKWLQSSRFTAWKERLCTLTFTPLSGRSWWVIVITASVAAFLVAAFVSTRLMAAEIVPDFVHGYHPGALGIQKGAGYVDQSGELITRWPPGMSTFISPWVVDDVVESARNLRFVSGFLALGWVVFVAYLMRLLIPRVSILLALGIAVFWPPMWAMGDPTRSEMLFTFLSSAGMLALVCLYRRRSSPIFTTVALTIAAWVAFAAAALTKTLGIAVALAMFVGIAFGFHSWSIRRRIAVLLLSASVFAAGLAPWISAYRDHTGHYGFTSNGLESVRHGLVRYPHFPLGLELKERSADWRSYDDMWTDIRELAAADRGGAFRLLGIKTVRPWYATWSGRFDHYLLVVQLPWFLLFVLASGRTMWRWKQIPGEVILLHGYVAALWLTAALVAPILRYLSPAFPFVVIIVLWHALDANLLGEKTGEPRELPAEENIR